MLGIEPSDTAGNLLQNFITNLVTCQTIQCLEIVQAEHQNDLFHRAMLGVAEMAVQLLCKQTPVSKAGKLVIESPDFQLLLSSARLLDHLFRGEPMSNALDAASREALEPESVHKARSFPALDAAGIGDAFGRTCYLNEAMPVIFHILSHAESYTEAVRANIQCGGDSCGRAWIIGPAMAATHGIGGERGIPLSWLARVTDAAAIYSGIEKLVAGRPSAQGPADEPV